MTFFKTKPLLSLLLALVMVVTMLPMTALAAEANDEPENTAQTEHICSDEACVHESAVYEIQPDTAPGICTDEACSHEHEIEEQLDDTHAPDDETPPEVEEIPEAPVKEPEEEPAPEAPEVTEVPDNSPFSWEIDADGTLYISGSGYVDPFYSPDDQPWADVRNDIVAVVIDDYDGLTASNIAYWFSGCTNLVYAEIPGSVYEIGADAFAGCVSLHELVLLHDTVAPRFVTGAFFAERTLEWAADYDPRLQITVSNSLADEMLDAICAFDWYAENCPIHATAGSSRAAFTLMAATRASGVGTCSVCKVTCSYTEAYEQWTATVHCHRLWCSNCGYDQAGGVLGEAHVFYHYNSSYDRCSYCGYLTACTCAPSCSHTSTTTTWVTSCRWERYCSNCGAYVSSGTTHGPYDYGSWQYYSTSQHRRYYTCTYGDSGTYYEYGSHSTSTSYGQYSATQHSVSSYCSTCASTIGSTSYANHSFTYGSWQSYNGTQHRRLKSCSTCGYSSYEYQNHALTAGAWASISDTQHRRTLSCSCGYSTTETANHALTYGAWTAVSDAQHQRTGSCSCGYSATDTGAHTDANGDGYCDDCGYEMTRFSVTVPASLTLTVSKQGVVYAANNATIVNNSTGAVEITGLTVSTANGWTLVPYSTNMAAEKVDAKLIGFALNDARSANIGTSEALALTGAWSIPSGDSFALDYHAAVSATSAAISEQVLTVVFVLEWA
jgi:hypothetical protein